MATSRPLLGFVALFMLGGCSLVTYDGQRRYAGPVAVDIKDEPATEAQPLGVLMSVRGVRLGYAETHPNSVEIRMRIDNRTGSEATLDADGFTLYSGGLKALGPAAMEEPGPINVAAGAAAELTLYFPFEEGDSPRKHNMDGLSMRWRVKLGEQVFTRTTTFTRRLSPYELHPMDDRDPWRDHYMDSFFHGPR